MDTFGGRLRAEREKLGLSQAGFGELGGVQKVAQLNYEKDKRKPDAEYLAAIAEAGVDVLYVLTGQRSNRALTPDMTEKANPVTEIDVEALEHIVDILEGFMAGADQQWSARKMLAIAVEIYNILAATKAAGKPTAESILKLVVNR